MGLLHFVVGSSYWSTIDDLLTLLFKLSQTTNINLFCFSCLFCFRVSFISDLTVIWDSFPATYAEHERRVSLFMKFNEESKIAKLSRCKSYDGLCSVAYKVRHRFKNAKINVDWFQVCCFLSHICAFFYFFKKKNVYFLYLFLSFSSIFF